ncbi:hypothetical protein WDV76_07420 [Xenorhabdus griffiniae]|uniref:hypothetical protein n=1 Tax=Xenorhabdus griffiniae TaxID=351672 RepID=UPI0030D2A2AA
MPLKSKPRPATQALKLFNVGLVETVTLAKNAVPNSRKINGKPLSGDINLSARDIGTYEGTEIDSLFGKKNFAKLEGNGWWQCGDTGLIIQWGLHRFEPLSENTVKLSREFKHICLNTQMVDTGGLAIPMAASPNGRFLTNASLLEISAPFWSFAK